MKTLVSLLCCTALTVGSASAQSYRVARAGAFEENGRVEVGIQTSPLAVDLTVENLPLYRRIIETYEGNKLEIKDGRIYINGTPADKYTFAMDYYFMMGDNRHNSLDSRYWGFVPEDHIVGKPSFVWMSLDKDKSFPANIRWNRIFSKVK